MWILSLYLHVNQNVYDMMMSKILLDALQIGQTLLRHSILWPVDESHRNIMCVPTSFIPDCSFDSYILHKIN